MKGNWTPKGINSVPYGIISQVKRQEEGNKVNHCLPPFYFVVHHGYRSESISRNGELRKPGDMKGKRIIFINLDELREHEEIRPDYLEDLKKEILSDGVLKMPICIDEKTCIILDGHHRLHALKRLGCRRIPCVLVNYQSPEIEVIPWREGEKITKEEIIEVALKGGRMPPKTSKHMILINGEWKHISVIEEMINVPLEELK